MGPNSVAQVQCFESSDPLAEAGDDLPRRCSVLKLMLHCDAQLQWFEASVPLADGNGDIMVQRISVPKLRPLRLTALMILMVALMLIRCTGAVLCCFGPFGSLADGDAEAGPLTAAPAGPDTYQKL